MAKGVILVGKSTGFLEFNRTDNYTTPPLERIKTCDEFHSSLPDDERRRQAGRCMDCGVPFCQAGLSLRGAAYGCPLHNLIPEWNDMLYEGSWDLALAWLTKTNNFPEFTGRVCPAPCEAACTCGIDTDPVTVRDNELAIVERGFKAGCILPTIPRQRSGKKVAVIGSGPAGLAAADQLNKRGHSVTVFEKEPRPGGLLMYGIPEMKLPKAVILRRVRLMKEEGVVFKTGCEVGRGITAGDITAEFDCVILCCGASRPRRMSFKGECSSGVVYATDYLAAAARRQLGEAADGPDAREKKVVIVGAGDTATDCVAVSLRQGCVDVVQLVRRPKADYAGVDSLFPTQRTAGYHVGYGQEEARAVFGRDPRRHERIVTELISDEGGTLTAIVTCALKWEREENSRRTSSLLPESEERLDADLLILATGFAGCDTGVLADFGGAADGDGNAETSAQGFRLGEGKVFAAGDMRRGQSLVVWAIAEGRQAAREADEFLMGYTNMSN